MGIDRVGSNLVRNYLVEIDLGWKLMGWESDRVGNVRVGIDGFGKSPGGNCLDGKLLYVGFLLCIKTICII